jgi:hypothetical protein
MNKIAVEIVETTSKVIVVDAETNEEALEKVRNDYINENIVLDATNSDCQYEIKLV